ncbi:MAG: hypothetical protein QXY30_00505 [Candidatus Bathyarchaeia archaeon]
MVGGRRAPICPNGCRTKTYKRQHMRRLYVKKGGGVFTGIGWVCPKCHTVVFENRLPGRLVQSS